MDGTDLSSDVAGIRLPNPTLLASGIADETGASMARAVRSGAGGVVTKSLSLKAREGHRNPVIVPLPVGAINAMGLPNPGVADYEAEVRTYRGLVGDSNPIIGSVFGSTLDEYVLCAREAQRIGVDAIEVNGSCPNAQGLGLEFGQDPGVISDLVRAVKRSVDIPVLFKLTPMTSDIVELASACKAGGADAVGAINTVKAMRIDVRTRRPVLTNRTGGLSGPAVRPIGVRCVFEIASGVDIPIVGVGGVATWEDAIEYILAGASAVQVGTAVMHGNLEVFRSIVNGIGSFMNEEGYCRIQELRGAALEV